MSDFVLGVDLNDYRKNVPIKAVKQNGGRFVIAKACEGTESGLNWVHETNEYYRAEASKYNMPFGNYMYWRFEFDAVKQAEFYLKHLGKVQFRPIVDVERYNNRGASGSGPMVSVQANINHLQIVLDTLESATGVAPMIYSNWATWNELFGSTDVFSGYEKWVANYGRTSPWLPDGWDNWDLWQWTSSMYLYNDDGSLAYSRGVDGNWFNGNEGEFEAYIAKLDELWNPAPEPEPEPEPCPETLVTGSILRANGSEELFVLGVGDRLQINVEEF